MKYPIEQLNPDKFDNNITNEISVAFNRICLSFTAYLHVSVLLAIGENDNMLEEQKNDFSHLSDTLIPC